MWQKTLSVHPRSGGHHTIPKFTSGSFQVQFGDYFGVGDDFGAGQTQTKTLRYNKERYFCMEYKSISRFTTQDFFIPYLYRLSGNLATRRNTGRGTGRGGGSVSVSLCVHVCVGKGSWGEGGILSNLPRKSCPYIQTKIPGQTVLPIRRLYFWKFM